MFCDGHRFSVSSLRYEPMRRVSMGGAFVAPTVAFVVRFKLSALCGDPEA